MAQSGKIAFHTMALFLGRAIGLLAAVVRLNFIASALGVESFGILSFASYFVALFATMADFGLQPILTREIARAPERAGSFVWNGLLLYSALIVVLGGLGRQEKEIIRQLLGR